MDEFGLQQQVTVLTHKSGGILYQFITSEEVEVLEPLVNFITSSDHAVFHFDLLQKHESLAIKMASCRNWQNFDAERFAENIVAPIDRDNPENFASVLMKEVSYVDKNHPLKTELFKIIRAFSLTMSLNHENIEKV